MESFKLDEFRSMVGDVTFVQDNVTNEKLVHAAYLLQNTTLPVYEIANSIGYENLSFFFEKFQKEYGMTPKEYRDQQVSFGESRTIL